MILYFRCEWSVKSILLKIVTSTILVTICLRVVLDYSNCCDLCITYSNLNLDGAVS